MNTSTQFGVFDSMRAISALILVAAVCAGCAPQVPAASSSAAGQPNVTGTPVAIGGPTPTVRPTAPEPPRPGQMRGEVAYAGGADPQVHLLDLETGESRQLTQLTPEHAALTGRGFLAPVLSCGFGVGSLRWSPDGSRLAFDYGGCDRVVYVLSLDGTLTRIGDGHGPAWSPDGARLVFAPGVPWCPAPDPAMCGAAAEAGAWNLQVADLAAPGEVRPLHTDEVATPAGQPTFSPDGSLIAFTARIPDAHLAPELFAATFVVAADGSEPRLIARGAWPAGWLADGRLLVVDEQTSGLRATDVETAESTLLGQGGGIAPASPDGQRIALSPADPATGATVVQLITLDGEILAEIDGYPAGWSPDSRALAIVRTNAPMTVEIVDRDGATLGAIEVAHGPVQIPWVAWRPGT